MTEANERELESVEEIAEELSDEALDRAQAPTLCSTWNNCRQ
jgi:hypothetical protein